MNENPVGKSGVSVPT